MGLWSRVILFRDLDSWVPSYLCVLATAINVDTFCDVSKLHFPLQLNNNIKKPKLTTFLGRLSKIDVNVASTPPGTLLAPIEVELLPWNQIQVPLGCSLLCAAHTALLRLEEPKSRARHITGE